MHSKNPPKFYYFLLIIKCLKATMYQEDLNHRCYNSPFVWSTDHDFIMYVMLTRSLKLYFFVFLWNLILTPSFNPLHLQFDICDKSVMNHSYSSLQYKCVYWFWSPLKNNDNSFSTANGWWMRLGSFEKPAFQFTKSHSWTGWIQRSGPMQSSSN